MAVRLDPTVHEALQRGLVIPACPLALTAGRSLDARRQRALIRYYLAAGAGGVAVGVHTTQFAIREPSVALYAPVLNLVAEELEGSLPPGFVKIAGVCGKTEQAAREAATAAEFGYHAVLLSLGALKDATEDELIAHCGAIAAVLPIVGFYLQKAVGGRMLPYSFWRRFAQIENVVAVKIAAFNRYHTIDVIRAIAESGRTDIALYTGNDDNIVMDLLTPFRFQLDGRRVERRLVGGLLGQWAVWTQKAVALLLECHKVALRGAALPSGMLAQSVEITDANGAIFDEANGFAGCIPGIHEVLRRQGLFEGTWCIDPHETLSPGQREAIDRVHAAYPHLNDDAFVAVHLDDWLRD